jgi:hypothetical protein
MNAQTSLALDGASAPALQRDFGGSEGFQAPRTGNSARKTPR